MNATFLHLGIALGLGLLVGLQRERSGPDIAGLRTFSLVTLLGALCTQLGEWALPAGLIALAGLLLVGNLAKIQAGNPDPGQTTEVALLLMFGVGAYAMVGPTAVAIALGGAVAVLLHFKETLHGMAQRIGTRDFDSGIQFVLITLVILPVLPNRNFGPYGVLNPYEVWLMVVLIVAITLGGYVGYKLLGHRAGTVVAGTLGGLVSSTATTVSYSRRAKEGKGARTTPVLLIASSVVFVRVLVEIAIVARDFLVIAGPPLVAMLVLLSIFSFLGARAATTGDGDPMPPPNNPTELKSALVFGGLYAVILLAVAWAEDSLGKGGVYGVAFLSGLTDMDAITLSTARLVRQGSLAAEQGWRVILVASISNLTFKLGVVAIMGNRRLLRSMLGWWGAAILMGLTIVGFWPA